VLLTALAVVTTGCRTSNDRVWGGTVSAPSPQTYHVPPQSAVADRGSYKIRPCPNHVPTADESWFTTQSIEGKPGAGVLTSTSVIDAGPLDVRDGELWQGGGEEMPAPDAAGVTRVPGGEPHAVLLLGHSSNGSTAVAVEVRVGTGRPVVWRQADSLGGGTDAGQMAIAGEAALGHLRSVRSFDAAIDDIDATGHWLTPCLRYSLRDDAASGPSAAVEVNLSGDGGWPGAVGYDAAGHVVDLVLSTGELPWSLFGLPGRPPAEAVADEPTATSSPAPLQ